MENGYDVISVTLPEDVRLYKPPETVYGILAAPPCQYLTKAGNQCWEKWGDEKLLEALSIVDACLRVITITKPKFWALENPPGRLSRYLGRPRMYFDPCDYGDAYTKKTGLWGNFTPPGKWNPVKPIPNTGGEHSIDNYVRKHLGKPIGKKRRSEIRSITPPGFANAFFDANR